MFFVSNFEILLLYFGNYVDLDVILETFASYSLSVIENAMQLMKYQWNYLFGLKVVNPNP